MTCIYGVPQNSILRPLLFSLYISPISNITAEHGIYHAQYADDTQLYINLKTTALTVHFKPASYRLILGSTLTGLLHNPRSHHLQWQAELNFQQSAVHTDFIILIWSAAKLQYCRWLKVSVSHSSDLTVMTFTAHISNICLRHIRKCLTDDDAKMATLPKPPVPWLLLNLTTVTHSSLAFQKATPTRYN